MTGKLSPSVDRTAKVLRSDLQLQSHMGRERLACQHSAPVRSPAICECDMKSRARGELQKCGMMISLSLQQHRTHGILHSWKQLSMSISPVIKPWLQDTEDEAATSVNAHVFASCDVEIEPQSWVRGENPLARCTPCCTRRMHKRLCTALSAA